jgi:hypothetical protein
MTAAWGRLVEVDQYTAALQSSVPLFVDGVTGIVAGAAADTATKRKATPVTAGDSQGVEQPSSAKKAKAAPAAVADLPKSAKKSKLNK